MPPLSAGLEIIRLGQMIEASEAMRIRRAWLPVTITYRAFRGNGEEILRLLARQKTGKLVPIFWEEEAARPERALLFEVERLLLNYLASAVTLLAHQRIVVRREYPVASAMRKSHDMRFADHFESNGLFHFIRELRNYFLHQEVPLVARRTTFDSSGAPDRVMTMDVDALRQSNYDWTDARQYVDALPAQLPLAELVQDFNGLVIEFFGWHAKERERHHERDFREMAEMQAQLERAYADLPSQRT